MTKHSKIEYEDAFVKISGLLGGEEYVKVARALLNNENATDEEIASATGLKINVVRKALYDLFERSLISGIRVRDMKRGWFVYRWRAQRDQTDSFIEIQKKKALERLKDRLIYESTYEFYHCGMLTCPKRTFEESIDLFFKCPNCGKILTLIDNSEIKKALEWKIKEITEEMKNVNERSESKG
ncbi:MAG: transcription factor [archaeon]|nr:transcription factor [archaeon]MCP8320278.1 transcription factor [archaeon]